MASYFDFSDVPQNKYRVILADPDWEFQTYSAKGKGKSPDRHYKGGKTSSIDVICSQPVGAMADPDGAVLFMWTTWPHIFNAQRVMEAWGFQYSGLAWEWLKLNRATGKFSFGGGYGTRKNLEPCLMGRTKGFSFKNERKAGNIRDFLFAPHPGIHSKKPDEQYGLIEHLFDGPYLELYARQEWPGWDAAGYEVDKFQAEKPGHYSDMVDACQRY